MGRQSYQDPASPASDSSDILRQELELVRAREELAKLRAELIDKLQRVGKLTHDEAKEEILRQVDKELDEEISLKIRQSRERIKQDADAKAREILVDAMKHGVVDITAEYTISTVKLPDDSVKGQIIGQGGRNIRTFEHVTGVDVDLDETPGEIRLSSFDSIRREIARVALLRLIKDGRIQPSRIEEIVALTRQEIDRQIFEAGKQLAEDVKVYNLPTELLQILGRFKFRFSYGQNMIIHTLEETKIGVAIAHELKADADVVRLGCLLHDIGKVVTGEEGNHIELGVKLLKKFDLPQKVIDCVAQHHEDEPFTSVESVIVYIADAISGSRPGARYEDYEEYSSRLKKLENLALSFPGVKEAYAIQAGREIRVITKPEEITDAAVTRLAHDIAKKVQSEMTYPGTVTVNVIREVRVSDIAR